MPSMSKSQQRLFQAAEHGANFYKARQLRASLAPEQLHDFSVGSEKGKPERVKKAKAVSGQHPHRNLGKFLHPPKKAR